MRSSKINSLENKNEFNSIQKELLEIHLPYEIDMLLYSIEILKNQSDANGQLSLTGLMSFECFFLHARNLSEFLKRTEDVIPNKNDGTKNKDTNGSASAGSFTTKEFTKKRKYNCQDKSFDRYNDLINDQITHLGYDRGDNAEHILKRHDIDSIAKALLEDIKSFEDNLRPEAKKVWIKRKIKKLEDINVSLVNSATNVIQSSTVVCSNALNSAGNFFIYSPSERNISLKKGE